MKLFASVACILLLASCASTKNQDISSLTGKWQLVNFNAGGKSYEEVYGQRKAEMQFDLDKNGIAGTTGCNRFSSSFTASGDDFTINPQIITTKMACPGFEESFFLDALSRINRYEVKNEQLFFYNDSETLMVFKRI